MSGAALAAGLLADGFAVQDDFVAAARVDELVACAQQRRACGQFRPAGIGDAQRRPDIRGDSTCWLAEPLLPAERPLLDRLEELRLDLNREGIHGLFDLEAHYAWYPPGAGYARHVDQPRGRAQRRVSLVLYLNTGWTAGAGGELRLFVAAGPVDIEPRAGRLTCFLTEGLEHEVLPTRADRLSITGWLRQRM